MSYPRDEEIAIATYVRLIRTAETLHGEVSRGLVPDGVTASQFSTLKALRMRGPLAQRDIAAYLLKTGGNVTVVIDNLEKQGLVTRIRDTEDRRIVFVKLTSAGEETFDRLYPAHRRRIIDAVSQLNRAEWEALDTLLEKLNPNVDMQLCAPSAAMDEILAAG